MDSPLIRERGRYVQLIAGLARDDRDDSIFGNYRSLTRVAVPVANERDRKNRDCRARRPRKKKNAWVRNARFQTQGLWRFAIIIVTIGDMSGRPGPLMTRLRCRLTHHPLFHFLTN